MNDKAVYAMAVAPHPFDNDWGMAGTVARWTGEGKDVIYVICTNGDKGTMDPNLKSEELAKTREKEQLAAANILGVREVIFLRHPDLGLEYTPEFRKEILRLILKYRPEIVTTCDPDFPHYLSNPDHRAVGRAVLDAVWPYTLAPNTYPDLLEQGYQPHKVKEVLLWSTAEHNFRSDISDTFNSKLAAVYCHKSQVGVLPPGWDDRLRERTRAAAKDEDYELAEAFYRIEVLQRL
jgi:LmbE family N-acetylglucosaminyl deacetylase